MMIVLEAALKISHSDLLVQEHMFLTISSKSCVHETQSMCIWSSLSANFSSDLTVACNVSHNLLSV